MGSNSGCLGLTRESNKDLDLEEFCFDSINQFQPISLTTNDHTFSCGPNPWWLNLSICLWIQIQTLIQVKRKKHDVNQIGSDGSPWTKPTSKTGTLRVGAQNWTLRVGAQSWTLRVGAQNWTLNLVHKTGTLRVGAQNWTLRVGAQNRTLKVCVQNWTHPENWYYTSGVWYNRFLLYHLNKMWCFHFHTKKSFVVDTTKNNCCWHHQKQHFHKKFLL